MKLNANSFFIPLLRFCFVICLLFSTHVSVQAQEGTAQITSELARESFIFGAKRQALEQYQEALKYYENHLESNYMAGICYIQTIEKHKSLPYFLKVYEQNPNYTTNLPLGDESIYPDLSFLIGYAYHLNEELEKAIEYYTLFKQQIKENKASAGVRNRRADVMRDIERRLYECQVAKELKANAVLVDIKLLKTINSEFPDYAPSVTKNENVILFTSRRGTVGDNVDRDLLYFEDIYIAEKKGEEWGEPRKVEEICTPQHESSIAISADGNSLLLYKDDGGGDIYVSEKGKDGKWTKPKNISKNVNSPYKETSASISSDGRFLFFASDRPNGFGGFDLYVSESMGKGKWGVPINLGPKINTEFDDESPVLSFDGKTLFFASKGHKGMGGYDIYKSTYDTVKREWGTPQNLGYPINTAGNDLYYFMTADGIHAYYASVKEAGIGDIDIYTVAPVDDLREPEEEPTPEPVAKKDPEPIKTVETKKVETEKTPEMPVVVQTKKTPSPEPEPVKEQVTTKPKTEPKPIPVKETPKPLQSVELVIQIIDGTTKKPMNASVYTTEKNKSVKTTPKNVSEGNYSQEFKNTTSKEYRIMVEKEGFMFRDVVVTIPAMTAVAQKIEQKITLEKPRVGQKIVLRNVYFDFNKATLTAESLSELQKVVNLMKNNPTLKVEIGGHTDNVGSATYNQVLSQRRAQSVVNYLVDRGIARTRFRAVGYGESRPLASNDDEKEGRELNRRTEFEIVGE
jgi:outer membrane protein OmpA-like peptidoglycan-associated protein/tetratricopeptide (TPR) repeat protein